MDSDHYCVVVTGGVHGRTKELHCWPRRQLSVQGSYS
jgi:hypothetical protein